MDLFGAIVLAVVTAIGGGTLRDLLLGRTPVFWISNPIYIVIAGLTACIIFGIAHYYDLRTEWFIFMDALGLSVFSVLGAEVAFLMKMPILSIMIMGLLTGTAGGVIRDILAGEIPLILQREIYATASIFGCLCFVVLANLDYEFAIVVGISVTLIVRLLAVKLNWRLPVPKHA